MRRSADGPLRRLLALLVVLAGAAGCAELTEPTTGRRDPLLYEHNARFFGGRTFRWIPPVPAFVVTSEPVLNAVMLEQLEAWDTTLDGAGGSPLFAPQAVSPRQVPSRGIIFTISDLEGPTLAEADPFIEIDQSRRGPTELARLLPQLAAPGPGRRANIPEILATGEIRRCQITLDPAVSAASDFAIRAVIRHELGHCLGFLGHVSRGVMRPACCSLDMTRDVLRVMQRLYRLPPGTEISP